MRDITDFSPKASGAVKKNKSLYESALDLADESLYRFDESRRSKDDIPVTFRKKTHNKNTFLNENTGKYNTDTNATQELIESKWDKLEEELKYGATNEDLENEVAGDFGKEILQVCLNHGITRNAIFDAFDILKEMLGEDPDVETAIAMWGQTDEEVGVEGEDGDFSEEDVGDEDSEEEGGEEIEESIEKTPTSIQEMTKILRKKIAENRLRNKRG